MKKYLLLISFNFLLFAQDYSLDFDGINDYVQIEDVINLGQVPFTISMWINPDDVTGVNLLGLSSSNANYLWIQIFYSALNKNGRAGFVMPNAVNDALGSEKKKEEIRRKSNNETI